MLYLATSPQTGHLAKHKTAQVSDVVCFRLLYTGFVLDYGEAGGDAGRNPAGFHLVQGGVSYGRRRQRKGRVAGW